VALVQVLTGLTRKERWGVVRHGNRVLGRMTLLCLVGASHHTSCRPSEVHICSVLLL